MRQLTFLELKLICEVMRMIYSIRFGTAQELGDVDQIDPEVFYLRVFLV